VRLECEVHSDLWEGGALHLATNLSDQGVWLQSQLPLEVGEELIVSLRPPRWQNSRSLVALASVVRVGMYRRRGDSRGAGMGLSFSDLEKPEARMLVACLRGLPPPLPKALSLQQPAITEHGMEERRLRMDDGSEYILRAEGVLLTAGRPRPRVAYRVTTTRHLKPGVVVPIRPRTRSYRYVPVAQRAQSPLSAPPLRLVK